MSFQQPGLFVYLLIAISLIQCKKDKETTLREKHSYHYIIECTPQGKLFNYVILENSDTLNVVNYSYVDSFVFVNYESKDGSHNHSCIHLGTDNYAWMSEDSVFLNNVELGYVRRIFYYRDNDGFCREQHLFMGTLSSGNQLEFKGPLKAFFDSVKNGNVEHTAFQSSPNWLITDYRFSQQSYTNSLEAMINKFYGRPNGNLVSDFTYHWSSKDAEVHKCSEHYDLDANGFVIHEIITNKFETTSSKNKRQIETTIHEGVTEKTYEYHLK